MTPEELDAQEMQLWDRAEESFARHLNHVEQQELALRFFAHRKLDAENACHALERAIDRLTKARDALVEATELLKDTNTLVEIGSATWR